MSSESGRIRTLLVANRGEIALRILRAARELGIRTVAVYSSQDALARHRFSADVSYLIGRGQGAVDAYLDIADLMRIAAASDADAIHPGYGFLAENPALAQACEDHSVRFVGPSPHVLTMLGDKVQARALAVRWRCNYSAIPTAASFTCLNAIAVSSGATKKLSSEHLPPI